MKLLGARMEAGRLLEAGVLADMRGEESYDPLDRALAKLKETRSYMDDLYDQIGRMRKIEKAAVPLPEHNLALARILSNHPPVERVRLTQSRFANIAAAQGLAINYGSIGPNFDGLLQNLQTDLKILQVEHDQLIDAFTAILPTARKGGFATIMLSGRAALPEKIMHSADQMMVYDLFYNRACMTTIAADMQVYPKGFEWLPAAGWKEQKKQ